MEENTETMNEERVCVDQDFLLEEDGFMIEGLSRINPKLFTDVIKSLSEPQRKWVIDTGFENLLLFNITEYPKELCLLVIKSFDPLRSYMDVEDCSLKILETDVSEIIGLPKGTLPLVFEKNSEGLNSWRSQFPSSDAKHKVLPRNVYNAIKKSQTVDMNFKKNFIILMNNALIYCSTNPYIDDHILGFTGDLDNCSEFNWCSYLISCLKKSKLKWCGQSKTPYFAGSLAFLMLFYLERVLFGRGNAARPGPAYTYWPSDVLVRMNMKNPFQTTIYQTGEKHEIQSEAHFDETMVDEIIRNVCADIEQSVGHDDDENSEIFEHLTTAIDEFNISQEKCMDVLSDATSTFPDNFIVDVMKTRFIQLNANATSFVLNTFYSNKSDINFMMSNDALKFWEWLQNDMNDTNMIIFKWNEIKCYKIDFQSINYGELVLSTVIDVWCCLLNLLESFRPEHYLRRLFCFTETTIGVVNSKLNDVSKSMFMVFKENIEHVLEKFNALLETTDLIFFPMFNINHHYVVCYNLKKPSLEILDNKISDGSVQELYGRQIDILHTHFVAFIEEKRLDKANEIRELVPRRLKMSWQTRYNEVDCGVFAMRHMETYMGLAGDSWKTNILDESIEQMKQLRKMRFLYVCKIISSTFNERRNVIYDKINEVHD